MSGDYFKDNRLQDLLNTVRLVIFDMNGLILDDEKIQLNAMNYVLKDFNISITEEYWIDKCIGRKALNFIKEILHLNEIKLDEASIIRLISDKNRNYKIFIKGQTRKLIRKGVGSLIEYIDSSPLHGLALATSASEEEIEAILGEYGLDIRNKFKYIISGDQVIKAKPNPQIYEKMSQISGIIPSECLVLEDSAAGIDSASGAGMRCLAIPNRFTMKQNFSNATFIIDNLSRESEIFRNL